MQRTYVIECADVFAGITMTDDRVQVAGKTTDPLAHQKFMDGLQAWFATSGKAAALAAAAAHGRTPAVLATMGMDPVLVTGPRLRFGSLQECTLSWFRGSSSVDRVKVTMRETNAQLHCLFAVDLDDPTVAALVSATVQQYLHAWLVRLVDDLWAPTAATGAGSAVPFGAGVGL
jgi:hypothetical protein